MFEAQPNFYEKNYQSGESAHAGHARIRAPHGQEPGVIITEGRHVKFVLTIDQAYNLANQIADTIESHPHRVTNQQEN